MSTTAASPVPQRSAPHRKAHNRTHTTLFLLGGIALWLYLGLVPVFTWRNGILLYTWIVLGAALVPATILWVMVHRLRTTDTLTSSRLVVAAVIGGTLAVALGGSLDSLVGFLPQEHPGGGDGVLSLCLAGFVEEFAKAVLIVIVGWKVAKTTRNGLFLGGAVGLGFAVLETMGYIGTHYTGDHPLYEAAYTAILRGFCAPFCHVLWSALLGAALFHGASAKGRFRVTWGVLGAYVGVALLHGTWDGAGPLVGELSGSDVLSFLVTLLAAVVTILIGGLIWLRVARHNHAPAPAAAPTATPAAE